VDDDLLQISPSHLRKAESMCRRKLAHEVRGGKKRANKVADMRFAVSNRIEADAALAHTVIESVRAEAFVEPIELEPEQVALYRAARKGYLAVFGAEPAVTVKLERTTQLPDLGIELVGNPGLAVERADGTGELRRLRVGGRPALDAVDVHFTLLRTEAWETKSMEIISVDLISLVDDRHSPNLGIDRAESHEWLATRAETIQMLAGDERARAGSDCLGCPFIAGCSEHEGASRGGYPAEQRAGPERPGAEGARSGRHA
jgi:hypothetical protein